MTLKPLFDEFPKNAALTPLWGQLRSLNQRKTAASEQEKEKITGLFTKLTDQFFFETEPPHDPSSIALKGEKVFRDTRQLLHLIPGKDFTQPVTVVLTALNAFYTAAALEFEIKHDFVPDKTKLPDCNKAWIDTKSIFFGTLEKFVRSQNLETESLDTKLHKLNFYHGSIKTAVEKRLPPNAYDEMNEQIEWVMFAAYETAKFMEFPLSLKESEWIWNLGALRMQYLRGWWHAEEEIKTLAPIPAPRKISGPKTNALASEPSEAETARTLRMINRFRKLWKPSGTLPSKVEEYIKRWDSAISNFIASSQPLDALLKSFVDIHAKIMTVCKDDACLYSTHVLFAVWEHLDSRLSTEPAWKTTWKQSLILSFVDHNGMIDKNQRGTAHLHALFSHTYPDLNVQDEETFYLELNRRISELVDHTVQYVEPAFSVGEHNMRVIALCRFFITFTASCAKNQQALTLQPLHVLMLRLFSQMIYIGLTFYPPLPSYPLSSTHITARENSLALSASWINKHKSPAVGWISYGPAAMAIPTAAFFHDLCAHFTNFDPLPSAALSNVAVFGGSGGGAIPMVLYSQDQSTHSVANHFVEQNLTKNYFAPNIVTMSNFFKNCLKKDGLLEDSSKLALFVSGHKESEKTSLVLHSGDVFRKMPVAECLLAANSAWTSNVPVRLSATVKRNLPFLVQAFSLQAKHIDISARISQNWEKHKQIDIATEIAQTWKNLFPLKDIKWIALDCNNAPQSNSPNILRIHLDSPYLQTALLNCESVDQITQELRSLGSSAFRDNQEAIRTLLSSVPCHENPRVDTNVEANSAAEIPAAANFPDTQSEASSSDGEFDDYNDEEPIYSAIETSEVNPASDTQSDEGALAYNLDDMNVLDDATSVSSEPPPPLPPYPYPAVDDFLPPYPVGETDVESEADALANTEEPLVMEETALNPA